ncbi:response regulator transcription factor [Streptomyces hainanensis]|uniref:response regulator transcription factor n=1 Tax=Streptomyces hainanensis TaxID=402648 RepID=UPI001404BEE4|nr:response regulator transcription factor [Streptomyces hainanensis]
MDSHAVDETVNVAVIEDHPVVIEGIVSWLEAEPRIRVTYTGDTTDGLIGGAGREVDAVLLDLELHGHVALGDIPRLIGVGCRVVVYSQHTEHRVVRQALRLGASDFVAKHESKQHLVKAVLAAADDEVYVTPTAAAALVSDRDEGRPRLSERERTALLLWFQSMSKSAVARHMNVSPHTVDMFIRRARLKYAGVGRAAPTKADLLARAIEDGMVSPGELTTGGTEVGLPGSRT